MAKYKYTMIVTKVVTTEETFYVVAENELEAKRLAKEEAKKHPEKFDAEKFDEGTARYKADVFSYTCKPVEE